MSERAGADPADLWRQWYEMGSRMWQGPAQNGESVLDPWGVYRQWFEGLENVREQTLRAINPANAQAALPDGSQAQETWRKVVEATIEGWQRSADLTNELLSLAPRWAETVDKARENLLALETFPTDPLEFAVQWYNATSGPYSDFVQELIERDEFLEPASRFLQNYASLYKVFRKNSEDYLKNLQIPTRSDITRVASLIVALEEKVDDIEETVEDLRDAQSEPSGSDDRLQALEARLDRVEGKLDRLISTLQSAPASAPAANGSNGAVATDGEEEIKATDAARRKARDLSVNLSEVEGTGADGQITVEDVRKKGEA